MPEDLQELQQQAERDAVREAEDHYRKLQHEKSQRKLEPARRKEGIDFLSRTMGSLAREIRKDQREITHREGDLPAYALPMLSLHNTTLAVLALRTIINRVMDSDDDELPTYHGLAAAIGKNCYWEWRQRELTIVRRDKSPQASGLPDLRKLLLKRHTSSKGPGRVEEHLANFKNRDWPSDKPLADFVALGGRILQILDKIGLIELISSYSNGHLIRQVQLSDHLIPPVDQPDEDTHYEFLVDPLYRPMLVPPRPWIGIQGGGFLTAQNPELTSLVKHRNNQSHIAALMVAEQRGQLELVYTAINALQETPWQLNRRIHTVMHYAWSKNILLPGLPDRPRLKALHEQLKPLRELLQEKRQQRKAREREPDILEQKNELRRDEEEYRLLIKDLRRPLHERRALQSRILRFKRLLKTCKQLLKVGERVDELRFYFPFQLDYRGRAYPMVTSLNPQGNDHERALLEFADGKPLGEEGEFWLTVHVANTYGKDKDPFEERVAWVEQHAEQISSLAAIIGPDGQIATSYIANLPESTRTFWEEADKPWLFLAACFEWLDRNTSGFVSHLPVILDASASGFQHLSALSRDKKTAEATNLLPAERPQDIYKRVSDALLARIEPEAEKGETWAVAWQDYKDYIDRKAVKRGVMTTPYGVTRDGLIKQLCNYIEELKDPNPWQDKDPWSDATKLASELGKCIKEVVPGAIKVMEWLQDVAIRLCKDFSLGVTWTTPAGLPVVVEHHQEKVKRVSWTNRYTGKRDEIVLRLPDPGNLGLDREKQKSTIAPNFIHSLDAAHMMLTLHRLYGEGLRHFSMIHDGYAVHACDIPSMLHALKEEFVSMYRKPLLEQFLDEQLAAVASRRSALSRDPATKPPAFKETYPRPGDLDLEEVLMSEYMFS